MPGTMEKSVIRVEGPDDKHALIHLLIRHGIDYDSKPWLPEFPEFKETEGLPNMLTGMATEIELSSGRAVGFVLDADSPLMNRWEAVRNCLKTVNVNTPKQPPAEGFIGESDSYRAKIGVWLMPDNQHDGKLETLLRTLIDEKDTLIEHATTATGTAKELGADFSETDRIKAVLHAWLAWQKEPGLSYGTAIKARFFGHDSPVAEVFVSWFKDLFGIQ